jgi:regulator of protease activity HflC (stomatin/prohibitin superfamily)
MRENDHKHDAGQEPGQRDLREDLAPEQQAPVPETEPAPELAGSQALARALKGSFTVLKVSMIALVAFYLLSGIFYVQPQEVRFKVRFGNVVSLHENPALRPGSIHIRWPGEQVAVVSTDEKALDLTQEFWANYPNEPNQRKGSLDVRQDGYLISGDANIVHMQMRVRYRVRGDADGALSYLFAVKDPEEILRRAVRDSTVKVVGSMEVMEVIKRQKLLETIKRDLVARVADFEKKAGLPLGIEVREVEAIESERVKNPTEPLAVRDAFTEAQNASSLREKLVEEGRTQSTAILADAEANAKEIVAQARGDKARLVEGTRADAKAMAELLPMYERSPQEADILREAFYQRALQQVLESAKHVFVLYEPEAGTHRETRILLASQPGPKKKQPLQQDQNKPQPAGPR